MQNSHNKFVVQYKITTFTIKR